MKIKAIFTALMMCILVFALTSCQLKKPESEVNSTFGDRLIGVVITTESLNIFDMEAYLEENIEDIVGGKDNIVGIEDKENYSGKIYAKRVTKTDKGENDEIITHDEYVFDDIDGFWLFDAKIPETETAESYTCLCNEGGFSNLHTAIHRTDTDEEEIESTELTADLYYSYEKWGTVFYMNPVYQESDGDIYCVEGSGYSVSGEKGSIDGSLSGSQSISDKVTVTENDSKVIYESKVTINYIPVYEPYETEFVFMNSSNKAIKEESYDPEKVPDELKVPDGTEYIILIQKSEKGSIADAIGKNCENAEFLMKSEKGFCEMRSVELSW